MFCKKILAVVPNARRSSCMLFRPTQILRSSETYTHNLDRDETGNSHVTLRQRHERSNPHHNHFLGRSLSPQKGVLRCAPCKKDVIEGHWKEHITGKKHLFALARERILARKDGATLNSTEKDGTPMRTNHIYCTVCQKGISVNPRDATDTQWIQHVNGPNHTKKKKRL